MGRGGSGLGLSTPVYHEVSSPSQARSNDDRTYSTFQQEFQFVQGLDSKAIRKKTRSWVTTQHYRKKRYEEARAEAAANPISKRKGRGHLESSSRPSRSDDERLGGKNEERMRPERAVMGECLLQRLGGGRADPFNSYPIAASRDVHELVDHFYFVIPSLVHRYWQRAARRPRACWDLFNLYRTHEIPFLGMLHHAAHHLAAMNGQHESLQIIDFKQRSLKAINNSLRERQKADDDGIIIGVGLLANAERIWGNQETARMHWAALKQLLLERGGFPSLQHNPAMHTKLVWSFVALSWPTENDNAPYIDGFTETPAATPGFQATNTQSGCPRTSDEFVHFFNTRRSQALKSLPSTPAQQRDLKTYHYRTTFFSNTSELGKSLNSTETENLSPDQRKAVENCRMACLIYLNLIMADYGDFSPATEYYLKALKDILAQDDDDSSLSAEHLLWTILSAFPPNEHYKRIWKMSRLMSVVKRTEAQTWTAIENALRTFLRLPGSVADLEMVASQWDREEFLREVEHVDDEEVDGRYYGEVSQAA